MEKKAVSGQSDSVLCQLLSVEERLSTTNNIKMKAVLCAAVALLLCSEYVDLKVFHVIFLVHEKKGVVIGNTAFSDEEGLIVYPNVMPCHYKATYTQMNVFHVFEYRSGIARSCEPAVTERSLFN